MRTLPDISMYRGPAVVPEPFLPDPKAQWWTTRDVAAYLGVARGTVSAYRHRGQMPTPKDKIGASWVWPPAVILEWRPGGRVGEGFPEPAGPPTLNLTHRELVALQQAVSLAERVFPQFGLAGRAQAARRAMDKVQACSRPIK